MGKQATSKELENMSSRGPSSESSDQTTRELYYSSRDYLDRPHQPPRSKYEKPLKRTKVGADGGGKSAAGQGIARVPGKQTLVLLLFFIGLIICVSSLAGLLLLPTFVSNQIAKKLVLKNNSMLLERWSKPNVPMFFKVWLFNVKNSQELIERRDSKPQIEEIGPFVFNLRRQKDVVSFAGDNLYYTERRIYHFNRELSCCAINTTVTIPNIPLVAVVDRALSYNLPIVGRFIPRLINRAIQTLREQLFVKRQVREILFDGYDVELLRMVSRVGSLVGLPQQSQRFALLKGRNDTWRPEQDGVWAINTGQRDRRQFGRVSSWNSYKRLPFWSGAQCNVINGSDGTLFPPPIKRTEPLYIFNQELCRTVNLVYDGPSDVRSIQAYRFVLNPMNFAHTMSPTTQATSTESSSNSNNISGGGDSHSPERVNPTSMNQRPATGTSASIANSGQLTAMAPPAHKPADTLKASASEPKPSAARPHLVNLVEESGDLAQLNQQARLIRMAQERQLASERRAESQPNSHACFCDRKSTNLNGVNVCEFDGLIDLSKCSKQAQVIFGSMPHFHNSDPRLLRQVSGLAPNASRHTTYLNIEPNTGLVLGGKRRVQLNVIIKHNNEIDGFENIQDMLVPVVWFEESAQIPEESAQKFRSLYVERVRLVNWTLVGLFLASLLLLAVDARLLLVGHYWRRLKFAGPPQAQNVAPVKLQNSAETTLNKGKKVPLVVAPVGELLTSRTRHSGNFGAVGASHLPLLERGDSSSSDSTRYSSTLTLAQSSNSSGASSQLADTPPNSPELRAKWLGSQSAATTRIYLNAASRPERRQNAPEVDGVKEATAPPPPPPPPVD